MWIHFTQTLGVLGDLEWYTRTVCTTAWPSSAQVTVMKNITLSADEELIAAARRRAAAEQTTLNAMFRRWLADYVGRQRQVDAALAAIDALQEVIDTGGRRFSRDEMNER